MRLRRVRVYHSMCVVANRYLVVAGGDDYLRSTEWLDTHDKRKSQTWRGLPDMVTGRMLHASCALGTSVYVFCGQSSGRKPTSSIEQLDFSVEGTRAKTRGWSTIQTDQLRPLYGIGAVRMNSGTIAIFGGEENRRKANSAVYFFDGSTVE